MSAHGHHWVVAGIVLRDRRALLCRRRDDLVWSPSARDLVRGHMEPEETEAQALARKRWELGDQLGTTVRYEPRGFMP